MIKTFWNIQLCAKHFLSIIDTAMISISKIIVQKIYKTTGALVGHIFSPSLGNVKIINYASTASKYSQEFGIINVLTFQVDFLLSINDKHSSHYYFYNVALIVNVTTEMIC